MSLEDFESSYEAGVDAGGKEWGGANIIQERIEKYQQKKEKDSKAMAGIQRTQKDEKKARRDDAILARILEYFLKDGQYSTIIDAMIPMIDGGFSSNLLIGAISLVFTPATRLIREYYAHPAREKDLVVLAGNERFSVASTQGLFVGPAFDDSLRLAVLTEFSDHHMPIPIRERINLWVEDMNTVITADPSTVLTRRTVELLESDARTVAVDVLRQALLFFFSRMNIHITEAKAGSYASFILTQLKARLEGLPLEEV